MFYITLGRNVLHFFFKICNVSVKMKVNQENILTGTFMFVFLRAVFCLHMSNIYFEMGQFYHILCFCACWCHMCNGVAFECRYHLVQGFKSFSIFFPFFCVSLCRKYVLSIISMVKPLYVVIFRNCSEITCGPLPIIKMFLYALQVYEP